MARYSEETTPTGPLRIYRAPWKGELVLACKTCQRKIRKRGGYAALGKVRRWFRAQSKRNDGSPAVRVLEIPCVKLCPRGAVTIFSARQLAGDPPGVSIARSEADLQRLYDSLRQ